MPASAIAYSVGKHDELDLAEQDQLRNTLNAAAHRLPRGVQSEFLMRGWSKLKSHFKVTYREIPRTEFIEALSIVERHVVEYAASQAVDCQVAIGAPIICRLQANPKVAAGLRPLPFQGDYSNVTIGQGGAVRVRSTP